MRAFNLIVSCSENRVIGRNGRLPWSIPEDRRFFEEKTAGQIVVLGRICFETWPAASREGRRAVVVTRNSRLAAPAVRTAPSLPAALDIAQALPGEIYICGGERIYQEAMALPGPARLYLTLVHAQVAGDRSFPDWRQRFPREIERRESADDKWRYTFLTLEQS
jgi:dihydrofolate reductase